MLNSAQKQAAEADGHLLVVALPGAGKTHMTVQKIDRLLSRNPSSYIGAVTFTRDAAKEVQERIFKVSGEEKGKRAIVGTFHRHAILMLRSAGKMPQIVAGGQQLSIVSRACEIAEIEMKTFDALQLLERIKCSDGETPETADEERLLRAYKDLLQRHGLCDLQDVVRMSLEGMQAGTVPHLPVSHMLVDEFQDTDATQLQWILEHAKNGTIITAVGDDDQSIYGWRHALGYPGMNLFKETAKAELITLGSNYRCRREILDVAERLIRNNTNRVSKSMFAERGTGGKIEIFQFVDREHELSGIVEQILATEGIKQVVKDDVALMCVPENSWAILTRNNFMLRTISAELSVAGIAHRITASDKDIWSVPPLSHFVDILTSMIEGSTRGIENFLSITGVPERIISILHEQSKGRMKLLAKKHLVTEADKKEQEIITKMVGLIAGWQAQIAQGRLGLGLRGIASYVAQYVPDKMRPDLEYGVNILANRLNGSLAERLKVVLKKADKEKANQDNKLVKLITMHGSKGLEFDNVWLPACETGIIPSEGGAEMSPLEEERRLFYVAMTRAKDRLWMSCTSINTPSLFLKETGLEIVKKR